MTNGSYGVVSEGVYDVGVYEELIRRIQRDDPQIVTRIAGDRVQLLRKMRELLRSLEHASMMGGPVDKALVVRDANSKSADELEAAMLARIHSQTFPFRDGVKVHAVRQEMDAWLLADAEAINRVATARGVRDRVRPIRDQLEHLHRPSDRLKDVLSQAGLNYTAEVCREIAREINLDVLRDRCPSFGEFEDKVLDP